MLEEGASFEDALRQIQASGLALPVLVKPIWADGRAGSHALAVVTAESGLQHLFERGPQLGLALPAVAQQYVPHGGCLFKVYVLGRHVRMVTRPSLDLEVERAARQGAREPLQRTTSNPCPGLRMASRVSAYPSSVPWGESDLAPKVRRVWFMRSLVRNGALGWMRCAWSVPLHPATPQRPPPPPPRRATA